jgi:opacity protein-like surface antigen
MFLRKLVLFTLGFLFTFISSIYSAEIENIHFLRNNALSLKIGPHIYGNNDYKAFWKFWDEYLLGPTFELTYERQISKKIAIEFSLGYFRSSDIQNNVLFPGDSSDLTTKNWYLSPTAKYNLPISKSLLLYAGIGPDYYRTKKYHFYRFGSVNYELIETFNTFGLHGLVGVEYYFFKQPGKYGFYDFPVSLIFEYKYSWAIIEDADKELLDRINAFFSTNYTYNDFDAGGHFILIGLKYHF